MNEPRPNQPRPDGSRSPEPTASPPDAPLPLPLRWQRLSVVHETRYDYATPVALAHHLAVLQPLHDAEQALEAFDIHIEPAPGHLHASRDAHGNAVRRFSLAQPHTRLVVRACSRVSLAPRWGGLRPEDSAPWDTVAERLRYVARAPFEPALEHALPSPHVPRLPELRAYAAPSFPRGRPVAQGALELMHRIHADFRYEPESTDVDTPLTEVLANRRGVCQDFAHVMAGALRMLGVPARYVSGYLLTQPPEGAADGAGRLVGADASHAWVQVWCPGTPGIAESAGGWLDCDPTNDLVPGQAHIRLAVGRDYGDVTPLRGVIRGGHRHALHVAVHTRLLAGAEPVDADPDAAAAARRVRGDKIAAAAPTGDAGPRPP